MILTKELVKNIGGPLANETRKFLITQLGLWGYDLDKLDEIEGNYDDIISFLSTIKNYEFDDNGRKIKYTRTENDYTEYIYEGDKIICEKNYSSVIGNYDKTNSYDLNGNLVKITIVSYKEENDKIVEYPESIELRYDKKGNLTYMEFPSGYWDHYTYDDNGNIISYSNSYGTDEYYKYDDDGKLIYEGNKWHHYEYEYNGDLLEKIVAFNHKEIDYNIVFERTDDYVRVYIESVKDCEYCDDDDLIKIPLK